MSNAVLIVGESGTGKSLSIRGLDPKETFLISVLGKPLPFRGWKQLYEQKSGGNYLVSDKTQDILRAIKVINERPNIKNIVLDDWGYILANEFMSRATEKGAKDAVFAKYNELGQNAWLLLNALISMREDMNVFVLCHSQVNDSGQIKVKTIGKLLDDKITVEGMFTIVLHSMRTQDGYKFLTQTDGVHLAKSPAGMFPEAFIDNDLGCVVKGMSDYYTGGAE